MANTHTDIFSSTSTWTCPDGTSLVDVEVWGGGGGASRKVIATGSATGGGGGGYAKKTGISVTPGVTYTITVGIGGVGVSSDINGNDGTPSWFKDVSTVFADSGKGGNQTAGGTNPGGLGGTANIGDVTHNGGHGSNATSGGGEHLGGGGGAGSAGDGSAPADDSSTGGAGGSPDGGAGGNNTGGGPSNGSDFGGGGGATSGGTSGQGGVGHLTVSYRIDSVNNLTETITPVSSNTDQSTYTAPTLTETVTPIDSLSGDTSFRNVQKTTPSNWSNQQKT